MKAYIGINSGSDLIFNSIKTSKYSINETMGVTFGFDDEVIYHFLISLEFTFKQYSWLLLAHTDYDYHPFEKGVKLCIYDVIALRKLYARMYEDIMRKAQTILLTNISNIVVD